MDADRGHATTARVDHLSGFLIVTDPVALTPWRVRSRVVPGQTTQAVASANGEEPRRLTPQGEDRKAELLAHAEALFTARGYAATRMADIAEAAGVTKGLFYWYFASKEALFSEIIKDVGLRLRHAQVAALAGIDDPLEQLYVGTVASVVFIGENARLYDLLTQMSSRTQFTPDRRRSASLHARDTAGLIRDAQRRGSARADDDPVMLAHGNAGVVTQIVMAWANGGIEPDLHAAAHLAARYVVRAVAATADIAAAITAARNDVAAVARPPMRARMAPPLDPADG